VEQALWELPGLGEDELMPLEEYDPYRPSGGTVHEDFKCIGNMVINDLEAIIKGLPPLEMQVVQP